MKTSIYNLYFPLPDSAEYIAYNTLSGSIAVVDDELKNYLERTEPDADNHVSPTLLEEFTAAGFLVPEEVDERKVYEVQYSARKYSSQELWVNVMTTYACNLACGYCYQGRGDVLHARMQSATTDALAEFIKHYTLETGCSRVSVMLYGGEPLLNHEEAFRLIDNLDSWASENKKNFGAGFITNGTLFTRAIVERMKRYKQRINQLTLDGPQHIHDRRRIRKSGQGTYEKIIGALELLSEYAIENVFLRIDVDKDNVEHMNELLDDLKTRNLQHIPIGFGLIQAKTQVCSSWSNLCIRGEESRRLIPDLWRMAIEKGFDVKLRPQAFLLHCGAQGNFSIMIDPVGDVYKCSNFLGMKEHSVGSILADGSLTKLKYEYYDWMSRSPMTFDVCRNCKIVPLCGGGCAGIAFTEHGTFHRESCAEIKYLLEDQLKVYLQHRVPKRFVSVRPSIAFRPD